MVEQRPFKPKVVGSIPTAPTNIFFASNGLWFFEGPRSAVNAWRLCSENQTSDFPVRLSYSVRNGLRVNVHRGANIC